MGQWQSSRLQLFSVPSGSVPVAQSKFILELMSHFTMGDVPNAINVSSTVVRLRKYLGQS